MRNVQSLLLRLKEFLEYPASGDPAELDRRRKIARMSLEELKKLMGRGDGSRNKWQQTKI